MRILIVDDDERFATVLSSGLEVLGHRCQAVAPGEAAALIARRPYDLAVVDADSTAGRAFLAGYRSVAPETAAVVLTSAASVETSVEYLRGGCAALALDYIQKPEEDLARRIDATARARFERVERGHWTADLVKRHGYYRGESLELTEHEFNVFRVFMEMPYRELSYAALAREALGRELSSEDAYTALRSIISRLRTKLRDAAGREVLSRHMEGEGMRFVPDGLGARRDISKT